jgi:hypothetical protein
MTAEKYLELVSDWEDPYPTPVIEKHNKFLVLRGQSSVTATSAYLGVKDSDATDLARNINL